MITIVVTHEDDQSDEFDFSPSQPTITIGRRSTNDVCIPNLSVSGRHARIAFSKGEAWIEDLNSTNGTYINNRLISRQILNNNDELVIGKTRVRFHGIADQKPVIQAEPAEVIDIRDAEPATDFSEPEFDAPNTNTPTPSTPEVNAAVDELFNDDQPASKSSIGGTVNGIGGAAAGAAAAGAASIAASNRSPADASPDSESMFEALADDLSDRDNEYPQASAADANSELADAMDDSSQLSISERAKAALGRNAQSAANPAVNPATNNPETAAAAGAEPVDLDARRKGKNNGATIEIKNGAKSGHVIPIDKPVTTLGRPGIQIAAIMRKPDGYFLMHIESNDSVDRPTLNNDFIGDEPMLLHPGDELNVAGINVEFDFVSQQVTSTV